MSTVKAVLTEAAELLGVLSPGQTLSGYKFSRLLNSMNFMLSSWSADAMRIFVPTREVLTLTAGLSKHTIGDGGDLDTTRPEHIFDSFITVTDTDYNVRVVSNDQYNRITVKSQPSRPTRMYYEKNMPLGSIFFFYTPDLAYDFTLISLKPFPTYVGNESFVLPNGYERAIAYNTAIAAAPKFGKQVPIEIAAVAGDALQILINNNIADQTPIMQQLDPTGSVRGIVNPEELFT